MFNALIRITREEGVLTLWRGCGPTVVRAMVVNAAQLASYAQAKQMLLATGEQLRKLGWFGGSKTNTSIIALVVCLAFVH